jgi:hypothetical protein
LIRTSVKDPNITHSYKLPLKNIKAVNTTQCVIQQDRFCIVLAYEFTEKNMYMLKVDLKLNMEENNVGKITPKIQVVKKFSSPNISELIECNRVIISKDLQQVAAVYKILGQDVRRLEIFDCTTAKVTVYKDAF